MSIDLHDQHDQHDESNQSNQSNQSEHELNEHDHRRVGRDLDLFASDPLAGPGLPLWLPDGAVIRSEIERLVAEESERGGCRRVYTPVLAKRELFERSGHWAKFAEDMFPPMDVGGEEYVLRPANCPHHALVYAARQRSFRDLPIRLSEVGAMFRSELSGVLSGLARVRQINLDDCHVFCRPDQIADEVALAIATVRRCYDLLGIEVAEYRLSRRGEGPNYLGSDEQWEFAESQLAAALGQLGLAYRDAPGEAAFYAPKIDLQVADSSGREESLSTIQLDFQQPERFDLSYVGSDGQKHRPVMIHRGLLSSMERMVSHLLESSGGALPVWLSPLQVVVLPVASAHETAADELLDRLREAGVRADVSLADETLGARVRRAQERKVPYAVVLGDREVADGGAAVRVRGGRQLSMPWQAFVASVSSRAAERSPDLDL
jgi:threonyl-tRNA synthetase